MKNVISYVHVVSLKMSYLTFSEYISWLLYILDVIFFPRQFYSDRGVWDERDQFAPRSLSVEWSVFLSGQLQGNHAHSG